MNNWIRLHRAAFAIVFALLFGAAVIDMWFDHLKLNRGGWAWLGLALTLGGVLFAFIMAIGRSDRDSPPA